MRYHVELKPDQTLLARGNSNAQAVAAVPHHACRIYCWRATWGAWLEEVIPHMNIFVP